MKSSAYDEYFVKNGMERFCRDEKCGWSKTYSRTINTTTDLRRHLAHAHPEWLRAIDEKKRAKEAVFSANDLLAFIQQPQLLPLSEPSPAKKAFFGPKKVMPPLSDEQPSSHDNAIFNFVVKGLHPFSIVEEPSFQEMIQFMEPDYPIPSSHHFSETVLPRVAAELESKITEKVAEASYFSMAVDQWSSPSVDRHLVTISVKIVKSNFEVERFVLGVFLVKNVPDSGFVTEAVGSLISRFKLDASKLVNVVWKPMATQATENVDGSLVDGSGDANGQVTVFGVQTVAYFDQVLQNIMTGRLKSFMDEEVINRIKKFFRKDRNSSTSNAKFYDESSIPWHILEDGVEIHWRTLRQLLTYFICLNTPKIQVPELTKTEMTILGSLLGILKSLSDVTDFVYSGSPGGSPSAVIPALRVGIMVLDEKKNLDSEVEKLTTANFSKDLKSTLKIIEREKCFVLTTLVDPRFKSTYLTDTCLPQYVKWIQDDFIPAVPLVSSGDPQESGYTKYEQAADNARYLREVRGECPIQQEVARYLEQPRLAKDQSVAAYWESQQHDFPHLALTYKRYACLTVIRDASERLFAEAKKLVTDLRHRMDKETFYMMSFVFLNN